MKTTFANIIDLRAVRQRLSDLEDRLGEILNSGNREDLAEFIGCEIEPDEPLKDFSLEDWISPDLEESDGEELLALRQIIEDVETCAGDALISEDHFPDYAESVAYDIGDLKCGSYLCALIDWDKAADIMKQDYNRVTVAGREYWVNS